MRIIFNFTAAVEFFVSSTCRHTYRHEYIYSRFHTGPHFITKPILKYSERKHSSFSRCGPDVTWWLFGQMSRNYNHDVIKYCRRAYPWEFDICLRKFAGLVGHCKPWDFKCTQSFTLGSCPHGCPHTVIICSQCVNHDVPGNIHYGYMGRAAKIPRWILTSSANIVQKDGIDNRRARTAVTIGMDVWDDASLRHKFCMEFLDKLSSLNRHGTSGCHRCDAKY